MLLPWLFPSARSRARALAGCLAVLAATLVPAQSIPQQIDDILAAPSVSPNTWSILIESADGSVIHYQRNPNTQLAPASNVKMFTTAAAFGLLGPDHSFQTRVYADGPLNGGVLSGNLNLVSEHDPTWNTSVFPGNARAPLDHIASRLKAQGLLAVTGNVQGYGCCFYGLSATDANNHNAPNQLAYNASAAQAFVAALNARGITVLGLALGQTGFNAPGTLLHTHESTNLTYAGKPLRLDVASIPLMKASHNVMADALLRHIGWKLSGVDSYAAGAGRVLPWLRHTVGLTTNGMVLNDGSGLSHGNRFDARQTLGLTRYMLGAHPTWRDTLPVGCVDGTLGSRFCGTGAAGRVRAKTGSLSIAISLSGYVDNPHDNQRYLFSFIANRSGINQSATRAAIDAAVVLYAQRGVPFSPQLRQVASGDDGRSIGLAWSDDGFVRTGYRVQTSDNGVDFGLPVNLSPFANTHTETGLEPGMARYYRVSVVGSGGESKPSRVYGAVAGGQPRVLVVDGNDRWQFQTAENPHCVNHHFAAIVGRSISGVVFDTVHHQTVVDGTVALSNYPAVVCVLGEESTVDETFSDIEQALVRDYVNAGGHLFVSGAEIGWDLDRASGPTAADRNFYRNVLRARYGADDANTYAFAPVAGGLFANNPPGTFDNGTHGTFDVDYPDVLVPTNGSVAAISYVGGLGGAAAVTYDGSLGGGRVVNWGFPFETITSALVRDAYMSDVLRFFGVLDPPRLTLVERSDTGEVRLQWSASSGLRYRVQYKNHLTDAEWSSLPGSVTATNTTVSASDWLPSQASQRFYRVMLVD